MLKHFNTENNVELPRRLFINVEVAKLNPGNLRTRNRECVFGILKTRERLRVRFCLKSVEQSTRAATDVGNALLFVFNFVRSQQIYEPVIEAGIQVRLNRFFI